MLLNSYPLFIYKATFVPYKEDGYYECDDGKERYPTVRNVMFWMMWATLTLALPCLLVFIFTTLNIHKLMRAVKTRRGMTVTSTHSAASGGANEKQISRMFMLVAVAFLFLRTPYTVSKVIYDNNEKFGDSAVHDDPYAKATWLIMELTFCLEIMNYTINFFLYCFSGSIFRTKLKKHVCCCVRERDGPKRDSSSSQQITRMTTFNREGAAFQPLSTKEPNDENTM